MIYLTINGVILTTIGAGLIGWNDILSEDRAIGIGVLRVAGETREENLKLPAVQELLRRNENSRRGLFFVLVGAVFWFSTQQSEISNH